MTSLLKTRVKRTAVLPPGSIVFVNRTDLVIPKRSRYKNFKKKREEGKWIIPVSQTRRAKEELKENLRGVEGEQEGYRTIIREVTETLGKYGIRRKEEKTGDKLKHEIIGRINKKNQLRKRKMKKRKDKIELTELQKLVEKKVREDLKEFENSKMKQIIDETLSIKKVKKELRKKIDHKNKG